MKGERCTAKSKTSGEQCRKVIRGGGVCHIHGGSSPQARAAREGRILQAQALAAYGDVEERSPAEALLAAGRSLDFIMQALEALAAKGAAGDPVVLKEIREAARESGRMAKLIQDAGLDERRVRLEEQQRVELGEVLRLAAGAFGLSIGDADVREVLGEAMARVEAGDSAPLRSRLPALEIASG